VKESWWALLGPDLRLTFFVDFAGPRPAVRVELRKHLGNWSRPDEGALLGGTHLDKQDYYPLWQLLNDLFDHQPPTPDG
jgi:hypothetical protein